MDGGPCGLRDDRPEGSVVLNLGGRREPISDNRTMQQQQARNQAEPRTTSSVGTMTAAGVRLVNSVQWL